MAPLRRGIATTTTALLLQLLVLSAAVVTLAQGSRFTFTLSTRSEECFLEDVDARSSDNKVLFRFGILEAKSYDLIDATIKTPSQKVVKAWKRSQNDHLTTTARESGLYSLCFRKLGGSSGKLTVSYSFDFISTNSVSLILYPNVAATIAQATPDEPVYTALTLSTVKGAAKSIGIVEFDLQGVSASLIRPNTRVQLEFSVDSVSKASVDIGMSLYRGKLQYPISWNALGNFVKGEYKDRPIDSATSQIGTHIKFDITELFATKVTAQQETLTFALYVNEDADASVFGMSHVSFDYYPQITVEDLGLDLMREIANFKETVFSLKSGIAYILHSERGSRDAAESTNSRVKWLSLFSSIVLIWIAFAQVLYIRKMLESSY